MLSNLLGVAPDHLKLAFSILSTYPCAIVFNKITSITMKHLFSIGYTSFIMLFVLQLHKGFIHITAISLISYTLLYFFKHYHRSIAWINFFFVILSMSLCHIGRQLNGIEGDTTLDYSGALMIVTIKLSSFGFNVVDGLLLASKKLDSRHAEITPAQFPSLVSYFGWCFYFAGFLVGPTCEYMDYARFIESSSTGTYSAWKPTIKKLSQSLLFLIPILYLAPTFNYFEALKPVWKNKPFWQKIVFIQVSAVITRCKYYFIWLLSEGACILSGFGFNGLDKDGNPKWNRLTNVNVLDCEFAQSYKQLSANWNLGANNWLRNYVYLRVYPYGSSYATLVTYVVSSLWHGFHPGYYIFFMSAGGLQLIARQVRRLVRPLFLANKTYKSFYDMSTWLVSMGLMNMFTPCFDLLHLPLILEVWYEVYYCHYIFIFFGTLLFLSLKPSLQKLKNE